MEESCCTCACLITPHTPLYDYKTEKPLPSDPPRRLSCCGRAICATCISKNPRFDSYCPFCQVTSGPSPLPQGLKDPPAYSLPTSSPQHHADLKGFPSSGSSEDPPAYSALDQQPTSSEAGNNDPPAPDVTHHLHPTDTLSSLSLAYAVPLPVLRKHNTLYSDHLISARRTISIPGSHYKGGISLSSTPVESEEEMERKSKLRKFMVGAKCHEYDVAELYLKQADHDLERALESFRADERWEKENPFEKNGKTKANPQTSRRRTGAAGGGGIARQV